MKTAFLFDMKMPGARRAADWLQKNGYQVDGAVTGEMTEEALQQLERRTLDLLVICPDTDYGACDGAVGSGRDYEKTAEFAAGRMAETMRFWSGAPGAGQRRRKTYCFSYPRLFQHQLAV